MAGWAGGQVRAALNIYLLLPALLLANGFRRWVTSRNYGSAQYYLHHHGLAPDADLTAHIAAQGDRGQLLPDTDQETAIRAAKFLLDSPPSPTPTAVWFPATALPTARKAWARTRKLTRPCCRSLRPASQRGPAAAGHAWQRSAAPMITGAALRIVRLGRAYGAGGAGVGQIIVARAIVWLSMVKPSSAGLVDGPGDGPGHFRPARGVASFGWAKSGRRVGRWASTGVGYRSRAATP